MWKEAIMASSELGHYPEICLEGLKSATKIFGTISRRQSKTETAPPELPILNENREVFVFKTNNIVITATTITTPITANTATTITTSSLQH